MTTITINFNERIVARVLLFLSILIPIATSFMLSSGSFDYGRLAGNISMYMALGVIVGYVATKSSTENTKNRVLLVLSLLIFIYSILATYRLYKDAEDIKDAAKNLVSTMNNTQPKKTSINSALKVPLAFETGGSTADFLNGIQPILKKSVEKNAELNARISALPFDKVLSPNNLISPEGIVKSRDIIAEDKKLIIERGHNLVAYWEEAIHYFKTAKVDEAFRKGALDTLQSGKPNLDRLYGELDESQFATLEEVSAILDLAEMNNGRLQVGNNQLLFDNQEGLDKYNKHLENINVLGQIQAKITQEIQSLSQARKEQIDADMKQISK